MTVDYTLEQCYHSRVYVLLRFYSFHQEVKRHLEILVFQEHQKVVHECCDTIRLRFQSQYNDLLNLVCADLIILV